jgi:hypothetical protein
MRQVLKSLFLAVVLFLVCSSVLLSQNLADEEYYEDFSQEHEWFTEYWNATGFIEITEENDGYISSVACPYTMSGPFFEVDLLFVEYGNGMAGIELVPADETKWNYAVLLDAEGYYAFYRSSPDGSTWSISKGWTYSRHILLGTGVVNHIAIEVLPRMILISFNGSSSASLNASVVVGGVALAVGTYDGVTTVRFDNLKIYKSTMSDSDMQ